MARTYSRPWRTLGVLGALIAVLYGLVAGGVTWSTAQWTPKLALDLDGGTEFVLNAVPQPGQSGQITPSTINEALKIIRQRVDGSGVSEAEITTQGSNSIVVSLPGKNIDEATRNAIRRSAALEFRAVLAVEQPAAPTPTASGTPTSSPSGSPSARAGAAASGKATASVSATTSATSSASGAGLRAAATPTPAPSASASASAKASPKPTPTDGSDQAWLTEELGAVWAKTDCSTKEGRGAAQDAVNDPAKAFVTCEEDGTKYALGPVEIKGRNITDASAGLEVTSQGQTTNNWQVNLAFDGTGADQFGKVTTRLVGLDPPRNQFAIVLDNLVISAPRTLSAITDGRAQITGNFTQQSSQALANQLKFGALPISFEVATENQISATLGDEQLRNGLLAGLIGLILVILYSLLQYRALGLVTVSSLLAAGVITYGVVVLLGWRQGYRLSLPGIAGLIVAIGITADSFIVYFERIRDEVRDGRNLAMAVELAWLRARRTILISDAVSLLAAVVLFVLAVGGVRGFAFTLGLTTLIDVMLVFLFTKPVVTLLSRTRFFGSGHRLSGFDAVHLGRAVTYTGRGAVRHPGRTAAATTPGTTIAERRAAAERAARTSTAVMEDED
ncbi:MAG: protein translocase subunit SecD [Kineosporiaceae bacterium]